MIGALEAVNARWNDALLSRSTREADALMHPRFALVVHHPAPARVGKDEWLRLLEVYVISRSSPLASEWDILGDIAVHSQLVEQSAIVDGVDRSGRFALSDTWIRSDTGEWLIRLRYSTPLDAGIMPRMPNA